MNTTTRTVKLGHRLITVGVVLSVNAGAIESHVTDMRTGRTACGTAADPASPIPWDDARITCRLCAGFGEILTPQLTAHDVLRALPDEPQMAVELRQSLLKQPWKAS